MSVNAHKPHLLVYPEDDANRQIAIGFEKHPDLHHRSLQIMQPAGGWSKLVDAFKINYIKNLQQYPERRIVLLMDFDGKPEDRLSYVRKAIPQDVGNRVYVIGVVSEPEELKKISAKSCEGIGEALAKECQENKMNLWINDLLKHNELDLQRLIEDVKPFLFRQTGPEY